MEDVSAPQLETDPGRAAPAGRHPEARRRKRDRPLGPGDRRAPARPLRPGLAPGGRYLRGRLIGQVHAVQLAHGRTSCTHRRAGGHEPPRAVVDPAGGGLPVGQPRRAGRALRGTSGAAPKRRGSAGARGAAVRRRPPHGRRHDPAGHPRFRHGRARPLRQPGQRAKRPGGVRHPDLRFHQLQLQQPRQHRLHRPDADRDRTAQVLPGLPQLPQLHRRGGGGACHDRRPQHIRRRGRPLRARHFPCRRGQPHRRRQHRDDPAPGRARGQFLPGGRAGDRPVAVAL